ncbi:hypothetical protein [Luteibacter jiangsuensis]
MKGKHGLAQLDSGGKRLVVLRRAPCPQCDAGHPAIDVLLLVFHWIAAYFGAIVSTTAPERAFALGPARMKEWDEYERKWREKERSREEQEPLVHSEPRKTVSG